MMIIRCLLLISSLSYSKCLIADVKSSEGIVTSVVNGSESLPSNTSLSDQLLPSVAARIKSLEDDYLDDSEEVVIEGENETYIFNRVSNPNKARSELTDATRCNSGLMEGLCYSAEQCAKKGGRSTGLCKSRRMLHCCAFTHTCGDSSTEKISYFRSPPSANAKTQGSLACDYDAIVQKDICAVRVEYKHVNLARKLGGVCDIDQIYILNSVDGPTTGQCGPLSGYTTTVAVKPNQDRPLKIALLIQNEATYSWNIKLVQIGCSEVHNFKACSNCGLATAKDLFESETHLAPSYGRRLPYEPAQNLKPLSDTWWSFPEPIFNKYYYSGMKKYLQRDLSQFGHGHPVAGGRHAERRIVGGADVIMHEFPWQVAIGLDNMFFCGGALINERFVLTAAHCIMTRDTPKEDLILHIGDHDLTTPLETNHSIRGVRRILFHSHFHPFLLDNDIALLEMDEPVALSESIQPICLPNPNESYANKKATVVGWGITAYPMGAPSPILQKIHVEVISNFHCSRQIEENVQPGMICAAPATLQGTCFGDSGGPLSVLSDDGRNVLIGLVSYGLTGCALIPAFPDIYTRVSEYIKWIEVNAMENYPTN